MLELVYLGSCVFEVNASGHPTTAILDTVYIYDRLGYLDICTLVCGDYTKKNI
jgi:hypothetical protein